MSLQPSPPLTRHNLTDKASGNSVSDSQFCMGMCVRQVSDLSNLTLSQFRTAMTFPPGHPFTFHRVLSVTFPGTPSKMVRVPTVSVVTRMKGLMAKRRMPRTARHLQGDSVRENLFSIDSDLWASVPPSTIKLNALVPPRLRESFSHKLNSGLIVLMLWGARITRRSHALIVRGAETLTGVRAVTSVNVARTYLVGPGLTRNTSLRVTRRLPPLIMKFAVAFGARGALTTLDSAGFKVRHSDIEYQMSVTVNDSGETIAPTLAPLGYSGFTGGTD